MKLKYTVFWIIVLCFAASCDKWLDVPSKTIVSDEDIAANAELAEAQFLTNYSSLRSCIHSIGNGQMTFHQHHLDAFTDDGASNIPYTWGIMRTYSPGQVFGTIWNQPSESQSSVWPYRHINTINKIIASYKTSDNEEVRSMLGEAYFIRAYYYFEMVKRYGGIPLVSVPFDEEKSINNRATEKASWDYVRDNLDSAITLLPAVQKLAAEDRDRANKYTALALRSRAMLYAATIAEYGQVTNNGLQGIPASEAKEYFIEAAKSAKEIVDAGKYSLTESFGDLFNGVDEDNNEIIFRFVNLPEVGVKVYHDFWNQNYETKPNGYCSFMNPTVDIVEQFETLDGQIKQLDYGAAKTSPAEFFSGRDKRLDATIIYPGGKFLGIKYDIYRRVEVKRANGKVDKYQYDKIADWNARGKVPGYDYTMSGIDGIFLNASAAGTTNWGFFLKKTLYGVKKLESWFVQENDQDAVVMRYGEVILNLAEAAIELETNYGVSDYTAQAQTVFNELRRKHGGLPAKTMTIDVVRHEHRIDLLYEGFRYWDLKRWRIGTQMHNTKLKSLHPVLHIDESTSPATVYYTIEKTDAPDLATNVKWFEERDYYCRIPTGQSPGITQNNGWN